MGIGFDPKRCLYLIQILAPERLTRIVDIGANPINDNPYALLRDLGKCEIWGFEPHPGAFERLQQSPHPNAHYLPFAVGAGGAAELKICKTSGFSSLLEPNVATFEALGQFKKGAAVMARQAVETKALDSIDEIPEFDLLKIDIQGGEVAVFEAGARKIGQAMAVITEVAGTPIYVDQPLMDAQMQSLRELGFEFHKFLEQKMYPFLGRYTYRLRRRRFRSQFVDGDAVFIRGLLALERLEVQRLVHLAILAEGVFDSQDVVLKILTLLEDSGHLHAEAIHRYIDQLPYADPR